MKNNWTRVIKSSEQEAKQHLRNLVYQVNNGGMYQYCTNGYADELLQYDESHDIVQELSDAGAPKDGVEAMAKTLDSLQNHTPYYYCEYCDGSGQEEYEDEEGNLEEHTCDMCDGAGEREAGKWEDASIQPWMDEFDSWFYTLNMEELDNWTEQSHNHSKFMDTVEDVENDEDYIGNEL